jgi:hypothetical protein
MRFACWITNITDTHSEYVTLITFHVNIGYANAPQCYVIVHCLSCYTVINTTGFKIGKIFVSL